MTPDTSFDCGERSSGATRGVGTEKATGIVLCTTGEKSEDAAEKGAAAEWSSAASITAWAAGTVNTAAATVAAAAAVALVPAGPVQGRAVGCDTGLCSFV
jgi:hypothetical protein